MKNNAPVTMIRDNPNQIPQFNLPQGYTFRWFQPGDEKVWQVLQSRADQYNDITDELFTSQFGMDVDLLRDRQGFILDSNHQPIATATAWFDEDYQGERYGRVHWVAVIPEQQGQGLSKSLMSQICNRLKARGYQRTYLTTSAARITAINLYLKFGFQPSVKSDQENEIWEDIRKKISEYEATKQSRNF